MTSFNVCFDLGNLIVLASCAEITLVTHFFLFLLLRHVGMVPCIQIITSINFLNPNQFKVSVSNIFYAEANWKWSSVFIEDLLPPKIFKWCTFALQQYLPLQSPCCGVASSYLLNGLLFTIITVTKKMDRPTHVAYHVRCCTQKLKRSALWPFRAFF